MYSVVRKFHLTVLGKLSGEPIKLLVETLTDASTVKVTI